MPNRSATLAKTSYSRVWTIAGGAAPGNVPRYEGLARAGTLDWAQGDITPVRIPSRTNYDLFDTVDTLKGQQGLPTLPVEFRYPMTLSGVLEQVINGCPTDIQVHLGKCKTPTDFNGGWSDGHVIVLEQADSTNYGTGDLGAIDSDQRAMIMETVNFTGLTAYRVRPITPAEQAAALVTDEVIDIAVCDAVSCGQCGLPSNGCQVVFALVAESSGSPGLGAKLLYTSDGGATWAFVGISTLGLAEQPNALTCFGRYVVVVSNDSGSAHYAPILDILAGTPGWTEIATGFEVGGEPNDLASTGSELFIVGDGGYVYVTGDITAGVTVSTAGGSTTEDLQAIAAADEQTLTAVGANNAIITTANGGDSWALVTGPAGTVATTLNAIAMQTALTWVLGGANGTGQYTRDGGANFTQGNFPGSGGGSVNDLVYTRNAVAYMAHTTAEPQGYILRSIDGGNSWYRLPEGATSFPVNDGINALAACDADVNVVFGAGLGADGSDGIIIKAS